MHNSNSQLKEAFMNLEKESQENIRMFHASQKEQNKFTILIISTVQIRDTFEWFVTW